MVEAGTTTQLLFTYVLKNYEQNNTYFLSIDEIRGVGQDSGVEIIFNGTPINSSVLTIGEAKSCTGNSQLRIIPNRTFTESSVGAFVSGLVNCTGETASVRLSSCEVPEDEVCSCLIQEGGVCNCDFITPSVEGNYVFYLCIDKNEDSDFLDSGESSDYLITLEKSAEIPSPVPEEPEENETEQDEPEEETGQEIDFQERVILILSGGLIAILILLLIILIMLMRLVGKGNKRKV
jgi:hypothetical protein